MAREKITHLFNRNHIEIIRIEHPELTSMIPKYPKDEHISSSTYKYNHTLYPEKAKYETVKKVSKLGFYYTSQVRIKKKSELYNGGISRRVITFPYGNEVYYQLKYVASCGENKIGGEDGLRSWEKYLINENTTWNEIGKEMEKDDYEFDKGHSGNSYTQSLSLAHVFVTDPDLFQYAHGSLAVLVGDEGYHDDRSDVKEFLEKRKNS